MENNGFFKKNFLNKAHFPTIFLLIGYIIYWIELYIIRLGRGRTSVLCLMLFGLCIAYICFVTEKWSFKNFFRGLKESFKKSLFDKIFYLFACLFIVFILICSFMELFYPPHLAQEFDSLNYHITLPKQHLILSSFKHLKWSAADLFIMPLQFALAPYWLITKIPNKLPQILFVLGLIGVTINLVKKIGKSPNQIVFLLAISMIVGSHGIGIQIGTAMLDIIICYLFLASIDSFLNGALFLSALEFCFFIWAKPFCFPQTLLIILIIVIAAVLFRKKIKIFSIGFGPNGSINTFSGKNLIKFFLCLVLLSFIIAGPFIAKSMYYAATPLYPFSPGITNLFHIDKTTAHWQSIVNASNLHFSTKDQYGSGHSFLDFIKHLWFIAVPEKGVNNRYDYPLGLPYLLFIIPFAVYFFKAVKNRIFAILPFYSFFYWLTWWFGSQQARFLYIPLIIIFITVIVQLKFFSRILLTAILIALFFNAIAIFRAYYKDFKLRRENVLREEDKLLLKLNDEYYAGKDNEAIITLNRFDVAYADFPVKVVPSGNGDDARWVLID